LNASTGIGLLQLRLEHRMKSVVTVQVSDVPWLRARRCAARTMLFILPRENGEGNHAKQRSSEAWWRGRVARG